MTPSASPPAHPRFKQVHSFHELITTPFAGNINALCWPRTLPGDFEGVAARLKGGKGIESLDEDRLLNLSLSPSGRVAVETMLEDRRLLQAHDLDPVLNCIHDCLRDENPGPVATDVFSFHVDSAPVEVDTWLCTYCGPSSEGLPNEEARQRVDIPETRAELFRLFGGGDDEAFREYLSENCYDLHYAPLPNAHPFTFGAGNLWRIATLWPGSPVLPCIHRAPETQSGQPPRLLLIS